MVGSHIKYSSATIRAGFLAGGIVLDQHVIAMSGHAMAVRDRCFDLKVRDTVSRTALMWAAEIGHETVAKLLLENIPSTFEHLLAQVQRLSMQRMERSIMRRESGGGHVACVPIAMHLRTSWTN